MATLESRCLALCCRNCPVVQDRTTEALRAVLSVSRAQKRLLPIIGEQNS